MRRFTFPLVIMLFAALLAACGGKQKIRVAVDASAPPFEYLDADSQKIIGFDIDLMDAVADKAGLEVEYINERFDAIMADLAECKVDAAISMIAASDKRRETMQFSERYFQLGQSLTVRGSETGITGPESLAGRKVAAQFGTAGALEAGKIPGASLIAYDSIDLAFTALENGEVDAMIADNTLALDFIRRSAGRLKTAGELLSARDIAVAVCKTNPGLLEKIDRGLASVKADGGLDQLIDRWIAGAG